MHGLDAQHTRLAVEHRLDAADEVVAAQDRQHVVAVLPLGFRHVHLEAVAEAEQRPGAITVVDQAVERRQERDAPRHRPVHGVWVGSPLTVLEPDAEGAPTLLAEQPLGLCDRRRLDRWEPALREVPEPVTAAPAHDRNLTAALEQLEHHADVAIAEPAAGLPGTHGAVDELPRQERAASLELSQHVPAEGGVLPQELGAAPLRRVLPRAPAPHPGEEQRVILDRADERAPFEQLPLLPEKSVELGYVERPEPAPKHQLLGCGDGRDRVDLEKADPPDRVEHVERAAVEQLRTNGDAPGLGRRHRHAVRYSGDSRSSCTCWRSSRGLNGFVMNSSTPTSSARVRSTSRALAVSMITWGWSRSGSRRRVRQTS